MSTLALPTAAKASWIEIPLFFPAAAGFYFVFRDSLTYLFFQADPVSGTIVNIGIGLILLFGAILYSTGPHADRNPLLTRTPPLRWLLALLALSLTSMLWSEAQSISAAVAYWAGMASDVTIVLLLLRGGEVQQRAEGIMKGAVWGAIALALVAWCSPLTDDLRLGNDAFLHPNTLGVDLGIGTLIAQYLIRRGAGSKWVGGVLAITLLRTLSKTAIIAFIVAECWYLMQDRQMTRKVKMTLATATLLVVISFWSVLDSYIDIYNSKGSGNQAETLTGRTVLWATAYSMSLEKPWFGHGFYSFKALIPTFGAFEPVHAHNELLQQFFEYGATGVVIVVGIYWSFYRVARHAPAGPLRSLALTLTIFAVLRGLADTSGYGLSLPLWLLAAMSIVLVQPAILEATSQ